MSALSTDASQWFTEFNEATGTAFSLKLGEKVHSEQSEFQKIEVYKTESFGYLMVIDDCTMVSTRDNFLYHEMISHPALNAHPAPKRVAIIGGGDCGTLREVLKHQEVEAATQIDIDERVTRVAEKFFPELCDSNADPRATLLFDDGVAWIRNAAPGSLDLIIVDSTDPVGPAEGLFGAAFYRDCVKALAADGMLVQQSESPLLHAELIADMHQHMRAAGFADTHLLHFPQPIYPSGWWSASIACMSDKPLAQRLEAADQLDTLYYSAQMHSAAFAVPPYLQKKIRP